ncbi:DUF551 domain-containing protein [Escherichia coli]|nr:DUF551 domain-containing protein [Escherichia coli]
MTTITKERLLTIKEWRETYGPGSNVVLPAEEAEELARIALASLEAKPIGAFHIAEQKVDGTSDYIKDGEWPIDNGTIEVYATSPVPVVPEEKPMPNPLSMYAVDAVAAIAEVRGWNSCRSAMLHAGNFQENANSSTNNFREIAETSTNSPVIPGEVLSAILKFARFRADFDDFDGDRRGIGDCLNESEQELIVTINKYASQIAAKPPQEEKSGNADCTATSGKTDNPQASGKQVEELTMLVKRLASSLKSVNKSSKLPDKAMDYLLRNGLVSVEGRGR